MTKKGDRGRKTTGRVGDSKNKPNDIKRQDSTGDPRSNIKNK